MFSFFTDKRSNPTKPLNRAKTGWEWFVKEHQFELRIGLAGGILLGLFIIWLGQAMSMGMA